MTIATLVACGGKGDVKSGDDTAAVADSAANGEAVTDTAAVDVDAVSSATNVANSPTLSWWLPTSRLPSRSLWADAFTALTSCRERLSVVDR